LNLKHFVTWKVSVKELEEIIEKLKETPCMSIPLDDNVELILTLKNNPLIIDNVITTRFDSTNDTPWQWVSI